MKRVIPVFAVSALLLGTAGHAQGAEITMGYAQPNVLPVLVSFDRQGEVASVVPSERLTPAVQDQLERNLRESMEAVATTQDRKASQLMVRMTFQATQRVDGDYDGRFVYLDATPVPPGAWAWRRAGTRYALVDDAPTNDITTRPGQRRSGVVLVNGKQQEPVTPRVRESAPPRSDRGAPVPNAMRSSRDG